MPSVERAVYERDDTAIADGTQRLLARRLFRAPDNLFRRVAAPSYLGRLFMWSGSNGQSRCGDGLGRMTRELEKCWAATLIFTFASVFRVILSELVPEIALMRSGVRSPSAPRNPRKSARFLKIARGAETT